MTSPKSKMQVTKGRQKEKSKGKKSKKNSKLRTKQRTQRTMCRNTGDAG